jgi:hypothetical protein
MIRMLISSAILLAATAIASAADVQLMVSNASGKAITGLTLAPKSAPHTPTTNLLPSLAAGASTQLTVVGGDPTCVYALNFTFASGPPTTIPDVDICQTTSIKVE